MATDPKDNEIKDEKLEDVSGGRTPRIEDEDPMTGTTNPPPQHGDFPAK